MEKTFKEMGRFLAVYYHTYRGQLKDFIERKFLSMVDKADENRAKIDTKEKLQAHAAKVKEEFIARLGGIPKSNVPLDAKTVKITDKGSYTREEVIFQARENVYITGSFYLPKGLNGPSPAVLFLCGHWADARMAGEYQDVCQSMAQAGLIVFAVDTLGQGERKNFFDPKTGKYMMEDPVLDHDYCGVPATATGRFLESYLLSDQMRAVDYLLTRKEVDPKRIGVTGNSGGGLQTVSMMVCDDRIAAAAPATFVTNFRSIHHTWISQDSEQIWPGALEYGFDHADVFAVFAPKPVAILAVTGDFFPIEGTRESFEEAKRFYGFYQKSENVSLCEDVYWHYYTPKLIDFAIEFFTKVFGVGRNNAALEINRSAREEMYVTGVGNIKGMYPDARMVPDEVRDYAVLLRQNRWQWEKAERKKKAKDWLLEKVMKDRKPVDFNPRIFHRGMEAHCGEYTAIGIQWWLQEQLFGYGNMISKTDKDTLNQMPTVIALWSEGTRKVLEHEQWIKEQCEQGKQVFVLDLPGMGHNEQALICGATRAVYGTMYHLCGDLMYTGDSFAAMQCYHVLRTIDMLKEVIGVEEKDMTIYCEGEEGCYGIMAGFLKQTVQMVYAEQLLKNVEKQILGQEMLAYDNTLSYIVPGMLEFFDYEELLEDCAL